MGFRGNSVEALHSNSVEKAASGYTLEKGTFTLLTGGRTDQSTRHGFKDQQDQFDVYQLMFSTNEIYISSLLLQMRCNGNTCTDNCYVSLSEYPNISLLVTTWKEV